MPWGLAGGLTPETVAEAIRLTGAELVDASTGLESRAGHQGCREDRRLLQRARAAHRKRAARRRAALRTPSDAQRSEAHAGADRDHVRVGAVEEEVAVLELAVDLLWPRSRARGRAPAWMPLPQPLQVSSGVAAGEEELAVAFLHAEARGAAQDHARIVDEDLVGRSLEADERASR